MNRESSLQIATEFSEDGLTAGQVIVNGPVIIDNHSLLDAQLEVGGGIVSLNGPITLSLQSSLNVQKANTGAISLNQDSHALVGDEVVHDVISCDTESRVWGNVNLTKVGFDFNGDFCLGK